MKSLNVVDSSGWLEYFAKGSNCGFFESPIEDTKALVVPTISIFEVFKKILRERGEALALEIVAHMQQGKVVDLNNSIALSAARLGVEYKLHMADSVMLATAQMYGATLWTQDVHFKGVEVVRYTPKKSA